MLRKALAYVLALLGFSVTPTVEAAIHGTVLFPSGTTLLPNLSNPVGVALADIDGDGWLDVVGSANSTEKIVWYRNNGDGTYGSVQYTVTTSPSSAAFSNVAVGDVNLDGLPDVVYWSGSSIKWTPNLGGSNPVVQFGYNAGNVTANQFAVAAAPAEETNVALADLNGDLRQDILSVTATPDRSVAWVPNLAGGFGSRVVVSTAGNDPSSAQGVDIDQDGANDLLVTSVVDNTVAWFRNLGGGTFGTRQVITNTQSFARHAAVGDINGDGRPDVVSVGSAFGATTVRWFAQNAPGVNPRISTTPNTVTDITNGAYMVALRDMDSDGWLDVVILAAGSSKLVWCENLGAGNFGTVSANQKLIGSLGFPISMAIADLDQNGTPDIAANANSQARIVVYRNLGGQTAMATADTAPSTLMEGRRDDVLKIDVSSRGIAGDSAAKLDVLALRLESSPGVFLNSAQANALIDRIAVHVDADSSGAFDPASDPAVATVASLTLNNGVLSVPFAGSNAADIEIAPAATRTYFVVLKFAELGAAQNPNSVRVTHVSHGSGRSILRDATTNAALTIESATIVNAPSAFITAQPAHTYADHAHSYFDSATAPGTLATDDFELDGHTNLVEFAFGMDPTVGGSASVAISGGAIVQRGLPVAIATNTGSGVNFQAVFGRRKDPLAGLNYTVEFSANLATWVASSATPTVLADDGVIEVVGVPYPFFVNGKKARFFRVQVSSP